jgi:hypothetical protein
VGEFGCSDARKLRLQTARSRVNRQISSRVVLQNPDTITLDMIKQALSRPAQVRCSALHPLRRHVTLRVRCDTESQAMSRRSRTSWMRSP